ncbi:MAG TPA: glycosyl hydrolase family 18 protein [Gammaproteobacteria bacterium]|nr:glycosyl hydrolase family 18 protein [Gammaproteobacteria bacterium]
MKQKFLLLILYFMSSLGFAQENLFYILRNNTPARMTAAQNSIESLEHHYKAIDILVPQAYQIDSNGVVWGSVDAEIIKLASIHQLKLMPLVTNTGFNKEKTHDFLLDNTAQNHAIQTLLSICEQNHYYGLQLDFEMIGLADKNALTKFYQTAADALHKKGFIVSFALAPLITDPPYSSDIQKRLYVNWEGAYDFKKLGESADFVSVMAYNQHGGATTPGSTAHFKWVEQVIKYALAHIPANKISLGVPAYSTYWFTGTNTGDSSGKIAVNSVGISYEKANRLAQKNLANWLWDDEAKQNMAIYQREWLNEYIFLEDARSFTAKANLAKKYNLRGISVFDLGTEDPNIWNVIVK